ncbi:MAG: PD40 domain-containing protein [Bacteroidales bacterium]|nr:PD40 domain-containing protein [Bacteroidales bacterium]
MKNIFVLVSFLLVFFTGLNAQTNKKEAKLYKKAHYYYDYYNYQLAIPYYQKLLELDSLNTLYNFEMGNCIYFSELDRTPSLKYYEIAKKDYVDAYFYSAKVAHLSGFYSDAIKNFEIYKQDIRQKTYTDKEVDFHLNKSYTARRFKENPRNVRIMNLGLNINSEYPEYVPIISQDERVMFFTSRRKGSTGSMRDAYGHYFEDIYMSEFKDGIWQMAENIGYPINSETHDACIGLSPDLTKMYIYRTNLQETGGGIYESELRNGKWQMPRWIDAEFNSKKSSEKTVCLTISPDSTEYYFVSNRAGGFGGTDIYKVKRFADGRWGVPENLGPEINTEYDEDSPFFHPRESTIYFSSKGHENMGDFDIFKSEILPGGKWSIPINLGYPLNTVGGDRFLSVSLDGRRGYYSTVREGGMGHSDIYVIEMAFNASNYYIIKGFLLDSDSKAAIDAVITITDSKTKEIYGIYRPNMISANYVILIEPGNSYDVEIKADNYKTYSNVLFYPIDSRENEFIIDVYMDRIK